MWQVRAINYPVPVAGRTTSAMRCMDQKKTFWNSCCHLHGIKKWTVGWSKKKLGERGRYWGDQLAGKVAINCLDSCQIMTTVWHKTGLMDWNLYIIQHYLFGIYHVFLLVQVSFRNSFFGFWVVLMVIQSHERLKRSCLTWFIYPKQCRILRNQLYDIPWKKHLDPIPLYWLVNRGILIPLK